MHIQVEANRSSRIEATRTTIEEDMLPLGELDSEKKDDVQEINKYIAALQHGVNRIKDDGFPLIREIHGKLMQGVRGAYKTPGEFRTGKTGSEDPCLPRQHRFLQHILGFPHYSPIWSNSFIMMRLMCHIWFE